MLQAYSAFLDKVDKVLFVILAALGSSMTAIMLYQVALRYFFSASSLWAEELARYMFAWLALLAASVAIRRNVHLRIDFVVEALRPRPRLILQIVNYTVVLFFLLYMLWLSIRLVSNTTVNISTGLLIPMAIPYSCVLIGSVLMTLSCVEFLCKKVQELRQLSRDQGENRGGGS